MATAKKRKTGLTRAGRKLLRGAQEALTYARGEADRSAYRVTTVHPVDVKALRLRLGLTQAAFAHRFAINLDTLRAWEQRRAFPDGPARSYLRVIERNPDAVAEALGQP
jgi:putative transcriptional regulator